MKHSREDIIQFMNDYLQVTEFEDYCVNGLQIEGSPDVDSIVLGVSSSARLFAEAVGRHAQMIIVHHGMFWINDPRPYAITGVVRNRIASLIKNDINLVAYHLPLDAHPETGNNAQILKKLDVKIVESAHLTCVGETDKPMPVSDLVQKIDDRLGTRCMSFAFGADEVHRLCVTSGAGISEYQAALQYGADTFVTGEIKESSVRLMEELNLNLIVAGHYNTEKFGVQALGVLLQDRFGIPCEFVDIPNPV
jgi:dinuclear metal center YbgI/SA1388 family protein